MTDRKKILIVDDDFDTVEAIRLILDSAGYAVDAAFDYEDGLKAVKEETPDLIILDVMMPGKTGIDLLYEIKKDKSICQIPVIMLTSLNMTEPGFYPMPAADRGALPAEEFIDKPAAPEKLLKTIARLIKKSRHPDKSK